MTNLDSLGTVQSDGPDPFTGHLDVEFGEAVYVWMFRKGITQKAMGEALGITQSAFSRKLRGYSAWTLFDMVAAARTLGVPMLELLPKSANRIIFGKDEWALRGSNPQPMDYEPAQLATVLDFPMRRAS